GETERGRETGEARLKGKVSSKRKMGLGTAGLSEIPAARLVQQKIPEHDQLGLALHRLWVAEIGIEGLRGIFRQHMFERHFLGNHVVGKNCNSCSLLGRSTDGAE